MEPQNNLELPNGGQIENLIHHGIGGDFERSTNFNADNFQGEKLEADRPQAPTVDDIKKIVQPTISVQASDNSLPQKTVSMPAKAADNDLIEDEWVKDLIKMIKETKGDPYARESQFRQMQVEYMKKRYNRIINGGK